MPPKGRKHRRNLPPATDFLSNLPDNIIDVILMCLPCKDAVRTSILSKRWRYHWCRCTEFMLDETPRESPEGWESSEDEESPEELLVPTVKFTKIINQILTLHEGPITKFTLDISDLESCPRIDDFLYFLSMNDIQHLVLHFPYHNPYKVPFSLFTCSQLRHLSLHECFMHPPDFFKGFYRLISLELCRVTVCPVLLRFLISRCPSLEKLVLEISEVLGIIEINAPMLRSFSFKGTLSSIRLKNVPLLAKVSLVGNSYSMEEEDFSFAKLFESCSALECLDLDLEFVDEDPGLVPTRLPCDLSGVKRFHLGGIVLEPYSYRVACALCLIRSFSYLEYLKVEISNEYEVGSLDDLKMDRFSDVAFNHLKEVELDEFIGTTPEMQLIEILLAKSPLLKSMVIDISHLHDRRPISRSKASPPDYDPPPTRKEAIANISKLWRASPKAKFVYKTEVDDVVV